LQTASAVVNDDQAAQPTSFRPRRHPDFFFFFFSIAPLNVDAIEMTWHDTTPHGPQRRVTSFLDSVTQRLKRGGSPFYERFLLDFRKENKKIRKMLEKDKRGKKKSGQSKSVEKNKGATFQRI
jgi:hypothetical protein